MLRTLSNIRRLLHAARVLARHDALVPREYLAGMPFSVRVIRRIVGTREANTESTAAGIRLARALESLGPAYIKLGQVLATRPDLIGDDVALALETLQDRLPSFPAEIAKEQVELALSKPLDGVFETFGEAVAAASIAQVHEATTTEVPPSRVAVKVLRPGVEQQFAEDLSAFAFAARLGERFSAEARRLRLVTVIDRLTTSVALELDLRMEAAAASELRENTKGDDDFRVPNVEWDRTGQRVMTAEWIDGISVRDPAAVKAAGHDPRRLAVVVIRSFLTQAMAFFMRTCIREICSWTQKGGWSRSISVSWAGFRPTCADSLRKPSTDSSIAIICAWPRSITISALSPAHIPSQRSRRLCAPSGSRSSAARRATCRWAGCCSNCSIPRAASTWRCSPSFCCCRKP
jgi:predicted unusual protein kinase regulating ubiquinone biosynthesis (AarF/ABC1/UbiB family)